MLKRFENDQAVAPAEKEFNEAQEIEAAFDRDFDGLDATLSTCPMKTGKSASKRRRQ